MTTGDALLVGKAQEFAEEVAALLAGTVADDVTIVARIHGNRVIVGPVNEQGHSCHVTLPVADNAVVRLDSATPAHGIPPAATSWSSGRKSPCTSPISASR